MEAVNHRHPVWCGGGTPRNGAPGGRGRAGGGCHGQGAYAPDRGIRTAEDDLRVLRGYGRENSVAALRGDRGGGPTVGRAAVGRGRGRVLDGGSGHRLGLGRRLLRGGKGRAYRFRGRLNFADPHFCGGNADGETICATPKGGQVGLGLAHSAGQAVDCLTNALDGLAKAVHPPFQARQSLAGTPPGENEREKRERKNNFGNFSEHDPLLGVPTPVGISNKIEQAALTIRAALGAGSPAREPDTAGIGRLLFP